MIQQYIQLNTRAKEIQQLNHGRPDQRHTIRPKPSHQAAFSIVHFNTGSLFHHYFQKLRAVFSAGILMCFGLFDVLMFCINQEASIQLNSVCVLLTVDYTTKIWPVKY